MGKISGNDIAFLKNSDVFEKKLKVTSALIQLFLESRAKIKSLIEKDNISLGKGVDVIHGKISRGENYKGYPWLVLDYPKYFSKESILAFRTIFWWGHEISFTLLLHGEALEKRKKGILRRILNLRKKNVLICVNDTPWEHHFKKGNYTSLDLMDAKQIKKLITEKSFLKVARKLQIEKVNLLPSFCKKSFALFSSLVD